MRVTIYWATNEGNHANQPYRTVAAAAGRALRAKRLPDACNNVGYEAHKIIQARARKKLATVATVVRDGQETSEYDAADEAAVRAVADTEPGIGSYLIDD